MRELEFSALNGSSTPVGCRQTSNTDVPSGQPPAASPRRQPGRARYVGAFKRPASQGSSSAWTSGQGSSFASYSSSTGRGGQAPMTVPKIQRPASQQAPSSAGEQAPRCNSARGATSLTPTPEVEALPSYRESNLRRGCDGYNRKIAKTRGPAAPTEPERDDVSVADLPEGVKTPLNQDARLTARAELAAQLYKYDAKFRKTIAGRHGFQHGLRPATSDSERSANLSGHKVPKMAVRRFNEKEEAPAICPPWGRDRDNADKPPWPEVFRRQKNYKEYLDGQEEEKTEKRVQRVRDEHRLDKTTGTSLESAYHQWGMEAFDAEGERQVFKELMVTIASSQKKAKETQAHEREDYAAWATEEAKAEMVINDRKQARLREMNAGLTVAWSEATGAKVSKNREEKETQLRKEKEDLERLVDGMTSPRRLRKPKHGLVVVSAPLSLN